MRLSLPMVNSLLPLAGWSEYLAWGLRRRRRFLVAEASMLPTLVPGETLLATRGILRPIRPGDIVVARHPEQPDLRLVKRVSRVLPGERPLLNQMLSSQSLQNRYELISDNDCLPTVRDSRHFGPVAGDQILAVVTSRLPSYARSAVVS